MFVLRPDANYFPRRLNVERSLKTSKELTWLFLETFYRARQIVQISQTISFVGKPHFPELQAGREVRHDSSI